MRFARRVHVSWHHDEDDDYYYDDCSSSFRFLLLIAHVLELLHTVGRGVDWTVRDVAQLRQWLVEDQKLREMRAMPPDWSLDSTKTKL